MAENVKTNVSIEEIDKIIEHGKTELQILNMSTADQDIFISMIRLFFESFNQISLQDLSIQEYHSMLEILIANSILTPISDNSDEWEIIPSEEVKGYKNIFHGIEYGCNVTCAEKNKRAPSIIRFNNDNSFIVRIDAIIFIRTITDENEQPQTNYFTTLESARLIELPYATHPTFLQIGDPKALEEGYYLTTNGEYINIDNETLGAKFPPSLFKEIIAKETEILSNTKAKDDNIININDLHK